MGRIDSFRGKYYFLSNFYSAKVEFAGQEFDNNEAAFQAMKCSDPGQRFDFIGLDPSKAKKKGKLVQLRKDWEDVKEDYMYEIVKAKFTQNENLKKQLLATGNDILVEGNTWNDTYWGICRGRGQNKLGKILMRVRTELRDLNG